MGIAVKLDDLLHDRRMTLTELAERIDITLANLSILKTGKARAIRFSTLEAICAALGCQPGDLLEFQPDSGADQQPRAALRRVEMAFTTATVEPYRESTAEGEVSLFRLYVLRAMYLVLVIGLGAMIVPEIFGHELTSRGVIASLLGAVWAASIPWPALSAGDASLVDVRVHLEADLDDCLRPAAVVRRPSSTDLC